MNNSLLFLMLVVFIISSHAQYFWQPTNGPYGGRFTAIVTNQNSTDFVATDSDGVFCNSESTITSIRKIGIRTPSFFTLKQNYPNPFNPTTTIKFSPPQSGYVTLKVFDILGWEVQTLTIGYKKAGIYSFNFQAKKLPGGVYFYKLQVGDYFTEMKKMLSIR